LSDSSKYPKIYSKISIVLHPLSFFGQLAWDLKDFQLKSGRRSFTKQDLWSDPSKKQGLEKKGLGPYKGLLTLT